MRRLHNDSNMFDCQGCTANIGNAIEPYDTSMWFLFVEWMILDVFAICAFTVIGLGRIGHKLGAIYINACPSRLLSWQLLNDILMHHPDSTRQ